MTKRRAQPVAGPPWGRGHYSEDGRSFWDEASRRWLPLTDAQDTLEIELEDAGGASPLASLLATLGSQFGTPTTGSSVVRTAQILAGPPTPSSGRPSRPRGHSRPISHRRTSGHRG
jgi:hypothetical protein